MANNVNVTGTGSIPVEAIDNSTVWRQVVTLSQPSGAATDVVGVLTEAAPASDTASSGLNGRLQRIAQRITTFITQLAGSQAASTSTVLLTSAATTNGTNVKASAGSLKGFQLFNARTSAVYLKFYNKATTPTVGTDTPVKTLYLPPNTWLAVDFPTGYTFATGIGFGLTTTAADNSTAAVASGDIVCLNVDYV